MQERRNININPFSSIFGVLTMVLVFVGLFYIGIGITKLLAMIAPILLVVTAVIDYKVILNYGKWLLNLLRKDVLMGIGGILLTVFGFPFIAAFLFVKALLYRKVKKMNQAFEEKTEGEFLEYEELEEKAPSPLELPTIETEVKQQKKEQRLRTTFW